MTQTSFTEQELEILKEALAEYAKDAYGYDNQEERFTSEDWAALQALSDKL